MPPLSRWMVRLSLVALLLGAGVGAALLGDLVASPVGRAALRQAHLDLMLFGWLTQFVLGVAYWILPRHVAGAERGPAWLGWTAFGCFQAGLVLAIAAALSGSASSQAVGRVLLGGATLTFVGLLWSRARPFGAGRIMPDHT